MSWRRSTGSGHCSRIWFNNLLRTSSLYWKLKGQAISVSWETLCSKLSSLGVWRLEKRIEVLFATGSLWWPETMIYLWLKLWTSASWPEVGSKPLTFLRLENARFCPGCVLGTSNTKRDESLFTQKAHNTVNTFIIVHAEHLSRTILRKHVSWSNTCEIFKKCHVVYSFLRVILHKNRQTILV